MARYLARSGAETRVTDLRTPDDLRESLAALEGLPITYTLGRHEQADFDWADIVVRNPAVPREARWLGYAREHGKRVEMEMTLFMRACPAPVAGVTGTKGKTTTTTLLHAMLRERFPITQLAGNMGRSAVEQLSELDLSTPVALELSSFQLEGLAEHSLAPHVAVITNIGEDHLDRYATFDDYAAVKASIAGHQRPDDWLVMPREDVRLAQRVAAGPARRVTFGFAPGPGNHALWVQDGRFTGMWDGVRVDFGPVEALRLPGGHARLDVLAAAGAALALGVMPEEIARAVASFGYVRNRLEPLGEIGGALYVNDTAATAPAATLAALRAYAPRHIIAIAGGSDKRLDLTPLADGLARFASRVVLLDGAATATLDALLRARGFTALDGPFQSMEAAVRAAAAAARPDSAVVLSPGCASFGMFRDEFDRGEQFRDAVEQLRLEADADAAPYVETT